MTGIKKIFKECFRYKLSGIAMVICLVISMLVAHYGILIFKNIVNENLDKENYQYQYNLSMTAYVNNMNEIPRIPDEIECNIRIPWVILYDSSENVSRIVDIIISSDEAKCPLISGEYPDNNVLESHERIILIGKDNMQYAYQKEGEWFYQIFGEEYRVIGVLGSGNSSLFDSKIVLYIDCLGEQVKKHLCSVGQSGCTITLESDKTDVEEVYNTYIKNNYNVTKSTNIETGDEYLDSAIPIRYEKEYCIIIYIFCFVCISIVLRFWLSQRVHEMKICRAFGYSDRKVVIRLLSSFVSIIMVSLFFFLVLVFLLNLGFKDMIIEYNLFVSWEVVLIYISIFLLSLIVIGVKPIYCFIHNSIVEGM